MRTIRAGFTGKEVSLLKDFLTLNGYQVNDATSFTEETKAAVIDFQKKKWT